MPSAKNYGVTSSRVTSSVTSEAVKLSNTTVISFSVPIEALASKRAVLVSGVWLVIVALEPPLTATVALAPPLSAARAAVPVVTVSVMLQSTAT